MRRETADLIGSGLLLAALVAATIGVLTPASGASTPTTSAAVAAGPVSASRGQALFFAKGCVQCHSRSGVSTVAQVGPDLTGLAQRAGARKPGMAAQAYVYESLKSPSAFIVPGYCAPSTSCIGMPDLGLTDDEIASLTEFLLAAP